MSNLIGGSLKLKGSSGVQKKQGKAVKPKIESSDQKKRSSDTAASSSSTTMVASGSKSTGRPKTPAELKFEEIQRQRALERAEKMAQKSHKERVAEFNSKLENLSEHYDIPKVGPG
ncbi:hypothetical protein SmJEL517_g01440 [Synchytrium microbalum]|uniref:DUF1754-domain-containing protein n=1 Tax=Synchytrium microbalum TaxID=1806994 RepID=A0A507C9L6_9FUNG|nr:uncharacterized protein SmJEL517_g01440 [Synchytrium microbalum]TPX36171.1 hypothetical protein SmJEL517_g01440 [Synchytrium microbalum]